MGTMVWACSLQTAGGEWPLLTPPDGVLSWQPELTKTAPRLVCSRFESSAVLIPLCIRSPWRR